MVYSTINHEVHLVFTVELLVLVALTDAASGEDLLKRRSNAAYYVMFDGVAVSARTHILKTIAG